MKMNKYIISDGNAYETYPNWQELISAAETWYDYISNDPETYWQGNPDEIPDNPNYGNTVDGDLEALNNAIGAHEEELYIAENRDKGRNNYNLLARVDDGE
jgi:hypothetical protein